MSYNGHEMNEFVPQRTAAYISQNDCHIGEMTVRETLAFSARCQGIGSRYGSFQLIAVCLSFFHISFSLLISYIFLLIY